MQIRTLFFIATTLTSFNVAADTAGNCVTAVSSHSDRTRMEAKELAEGATLYLPAAAK